MSDVGIRMTRLFDHGRCLNIAVDHGFFGEISFLSGIEDMRQAVDVLVAAAPDVIQLTVGQAHLLQGRSERTRPALALRTDVANIYGKVLPNRLFSIMIDNAGLTAVRLDAACVVVNLFDLPQRPEVKESCIQNIMRLKADVEHFGIPLMIEPLVMKDAINGGYASDGALEKVLPLVRQAVELGADVIKADPTDDPADYHEVIRMAGDVPVLVRGGGRVADEELLRRTAQVLRCGAAGIVYGRNIIQHPKPAAMTQALMAMLHQDASVEQALAVVNA